MKAKPTTIIVILIVFIMGFSGCSKKEEGCTDPKATNYSVDAEIDNGTCQYDPRDLYIGDYEILDSIGFRLYDTLTLQHYSSYFSDTTYILTISKDPNDSSQIILENLWGEGDDFEAVLTGSSFSIPEYVTSGYYQVWGDGFFDDNYIFYETFRWPPGAYTVTNKGEGVKQIQ